MKRSYVQILALPGGEDQETVAEAVFEELMAHNFPKLMRNI